LDLYFIVGMRLLFNSGQHIDPATAELAARFVRSLW
jgi:hypothetical protein